MTIEQNNTVYNHILVRFGELSTKGENEKNFIKRLLTSVKDAFRNYDRLNYKRTRDRLYIMLNGEDPHAVSEHLQKIFGISSFPFAIHADSDIEVMKQTALWIAKESDARTFKVEARRSRKLLPMISNGINRAAAGEILRNIELEVNMREPQLCIQIEVHQKDTYAVTSRIAGTGGYPADVSGKALIMLSGGIDSPIASYLIMKRGVTVECIHYASPSYASQAAQDKILELAHQLAPYQGHIRVYAVPFTDLQPTIYKNCDESYAITVVRRMIYRTAQRLCEQQHCLAIAGGESIGQVVSQTLEGVQAVDRVTTIPAIHPVVCMDRVEIINVSRTINTYDIPIQSFEDCCTIFMSRNPVTKPTIQRSKRLEAHFDYAFLPQECIEKTEHVDVCPEAKLDEDIFQYRLETLTHTNDVRWEKWKEESNITKSRLSRTYISARWVLNQVLTLKLKREIIGMNTTKSILLRISKTTSITTTKVVPRETARASATTTRIRIAKTGTKKPLLFRLENRSGLLYVP